MQRITNSDIENWFTYHSPYGDQPQRYEEIRDTAKLLAKVILRCTPQGADQSAALRKLREAVMTANQSIACDSNMGMQAEVCGQSPMKAEQEVGSGYAVPRRRD